MVYLEPDSDDVTMVENYNLSSEDAKTNSVMHNDGAVLDSVSDDANTNQHGSTYIFNVVYNLSLCALIILVIVISASMYSIESFFHSFSQLFQSNV